MSNAVSDPQKLHRLDVRYQSGRQLYFTEVAFDLTHSEHPKGLSRQL